MKQLIRILYLDDSPLDRKLVREVLGKDHGSFELVEAATRVDFDTALAQGNFDLILSDFNILGFEGLQLLEAMRAKDLHLPVIIVTGRGSEEVAVEAIKRGAAEYVIKSPKHIQHLPQAIQAVLEKTRLENEHRKREVALHEAEAKYRALVEQIPIVAYTETVEPTSHTVYISPRVEDVFGCTPEEWLADDNLWLDFVVPEDRERVRAENSRTDETGDPFTIEYRIIKKDGQKRWIHDHAVLIRDELGKPMFWQGILTDITERKQEEENIQSLARFQAENPNPVLRIARDGILLYGNQAAIDLLKEWKLKVGKPAPKMLRSQAAKVIETRRETTLEIPCGEHIFSIAFAPVPEGEYANLYGRDVTELVRAEATLRHSEAFLESIVEHSPYAMWISDEKGTLIRQNQACRDLLHIQDDEVVGKYNLFQDNIVEEQGVLPLVRQVFKKGKTVRFILRYDSSQLKSLKLAQTVTLILEVTISPVVDLNGKIANAIIEHIDITERELAEEASRESKRLLQESQIQAGLGSYLLDIPSGKWKNSEMLDKIFGIDEAYERSVAGWVALIHPDDQKMMSDFLNDEVIGQGKLFDKEYRIIRHDDQAERWVHGLGKLDFDTQGCPVKMHGTIQDITDRKRAEAELQASHKAERNFSERLTSLSETTTELSKAESLDELCRRAVELGRERLNFDRLSIFFLSEDSSEIIGTFGVDTEGQITDERGDHYPVSPTSHIWPILHGHAPLLPLTETPLYLRGQLVGQGTHVFAGLWDGNKVIGSITLDNLLRQQPFSDQDCEIIRLFASALGHLITLKRAQEEIRATEERYRMLFELSPDSIAVHQDGKVVIINQAAVKLLGASSPKEIIGRPVLDLVHPDYRQIVIERTHQQITRGKTVPVIEEKFLRLDGSAIDVDVTAAPFLYRDRPASMVIFRDISERKHAAEVLAHQSEEIRQRNEELARLYRASGSLLSGASLGLQELAQTIAEVIQKEFGQDNCSLLVVRRDSNELQRLVTVGPYADQVKDKALTLNGPGLIPRTIRTGEANNVGDVHANPEYLSKWELARSELTVPLKIGSETIGVIDIQSTQPDAFNPNDERLMSVFAERAARALENSRLYEQTETRVQQLAALRTIDMAISSSFDISLTLDILLDHLKAQLGIHAADILTYNQVTQTFRFSCGQGFRTHAMQNSHLRMGEGFAGKVALERRLLNIPDLRAEPTGFGKSPNFLGENFVAYLGVPLVAKGQIKGVLEVFQREPLELNSDQQAFLEMLAGQAGIAIDNAELFEHQQNSIADLNSAYNNTLEGWARALELRDKETEGHTRRVTEQTVRLSRAMGVKEDNLVQIYRGALLHDIGKIGVPDGIVLKPGPLTEEEWEIMRKHPVYAYNLLLPITHLREALYIPYCHHEKWNGTGYPRGLKGLEIPLAARIFSIVDVWDALTSDRPYRKAWQDEKARQYIQEQAGLHFDPEVVEAFLKASFRTE